MCCYATSRCGVDAANFQQKKKVSIASRKSRRGSPTEGDQGLFLSLEKYARAGPVVETSIVTHSEGENGPGKQHLRKAIASVHTIHLLFCRFASDLCLFPVSLCRLKNFVFSIF